MGFSEYFIQNLSSPIETPTTTTKQSSHKIPTDRRLPDQEILDSTEEIYFQESVNCGEYELKVGGEDSHVRCPIFCFCFLLLLLRSINQFSIVAHKRRCVCDDKKAEVQFNFSPFRF